MADPGAGVTLLSYSCFVFFLQSQDVIPCKGCWIFFVLFPLKVMCVCLCLYTQTHAQSCYESAANWHPVLYINWKQQIIEFALLIPRRRFRISSSYQLFFASNYARFKFHTCSISEQLVWIYLFNVLPYGP